MLAPDLFRRVLGRFPSGVTVVTARDRTGHDHGMTVSAFCSLSLVPPLVLICVEQITRLHDGLRASTHFAVSVLAADQEALSRRFAEPGDDRFDGVAFTRGLTGAPILDGALASLECEIRDRYPGGDHTILTAEVLAAAARDGQPLIHHRGDYTRLEG